MGKGDRLDLGWIPQSCCGPWLGSDSGEAGETRIRGTVRKALKDPGKLGFRQRLCARNLIRRGTAILYPTE